MKLHYSLIALCGATLAAIGAAAFLAQHHRPAAALAPSEQVFQVKGLVRSVEADGLTVHIAHEEIPGFMPAMEMPFTVSDPALLRGLNPGDAVSFELLVTKDDSWITRIAKSSSTPALQALDNSALTPDHRVQAGETVPDFGLVDQNGTPFRLSQYRGKTVVLTFIYTRCPLPNFCPLMSKNFASLQERFAKAKLSDKVQLVSVSFDPEFDTPAVLRRYADLYPHDGNNWVFATGTTNQVNAVTEMFGLIRESANGLINHDLRTALIGPDGKLVHLWRSNVWTPYEVQRMTQEALHVSVAQR